jgi:PAS domain S-box-containing protein
LNRKESRPAHDLVQALRAAEAELHATTLERDAQAQACAKAQAELTRQMIARTVLQHVIDTVPHSIFWKDTNSVYLGANQRKLSALGMRSVEELAGKTDFDTPVSRHDAELYRRGDREVMESGQGRLNVEEPQMRPDGRHVLLTSKVPLHDDAGKIIGVLGMYVDITDRKRMEEELAQARDAAEESARARKEFLTMISHELRTPLTLILGPLEALLSGASGSLPLKASVDLRRIQRNARRLFVLVSDILDFTKLEAGKMGVDWAPVDVEELASDIVDEAQSLAQQKEIRLTVSIDRKVGVVPLDRAKFEKIVLNLIANALKFTPQGGAVQVVLSALSDHFEISVTDTGPGIPADRQEAVFKRFEQVDSSSTRKHEGTGIGLALVKELTEVMGGTVGVKSEEGHGACFFARFPKSPDRLISLGPPISVQRQGPLEWPSELVEVEPAASSGAPVDGAEPSRKPVVLVVDDNADMRSYMQEILSDRYDVRGVENGRRALDVCRESEPTVIVSDIMMPEMDGLELVARLKQHPVLRCIPVILVTAKASREEVVGGLNVGADDYLSKPFGPAELRARVDAARRHREISEELEAKNATLERAMIELKETQAELVQAGKMAAIGQLVAGMSHELNNPIGMILIGAQGLLKRMPNDSSLRRGAESIERQANRAGGLVKVLLEYARRKPMTVERVALGSVVSRVVELARSQLGGADTKVIVEQPGVTLPEIEGCAQEVEVALLNVINNAVDAASPRGGTVRVEMHATARDGHAGVEIAVVDTGGGIPEDVLPRIFDPFFTTKPVGMGTGLGLALTRKIVESHGGQIQAESAVGKGTSMRVWLPAA